ncbi:MAG: hypothetical protein DI536_30215 [Archangium gephyra]|uniref:NAD-dependent epimerase/dehydratase domain-containing protein n=1 Tax=Archangium gephyra TaxID=48 RepID=A0A2W5V879_9BACT|nr:MAG: hypothetical protein DI536_30215 [Archangium gephyra]
MRTFVVGGAGFIGSHLVERLAVDGPVTVFDNFTSGKRAFLEKALATGNVTIVQADALELEKVEAAIAGHDRVFHLSANPEARWGLERPRLDLEQGTIVTWNVLEASRRQGVKHLVFSSSGTVYGNTPEAGREDRLGLLPFSLYGASKLAGETMIASYVECFGLTATICRFGNVVGPRGTHGAILDFCKKLKATPDRLEVLGNGQQSKPYLHVDDCVGGLRFTAEKGERPLGIYNLAPPDWTTVRRIAELCVANSPNPRAEIHYTGGTQGWKGDVPTSRLDPSKLATLGFKVRFTSDDAVERAVKEVAREVFGA